MKRPTRPTGRRRRRESRRSCLRRLVALAALALASPAGDERLRVVGLGLAAAPFDPVTTGAFVGVDNASGARIADLVLAAGGDWVETVPARRWQFASGPLRAVVKLRADGTRYRLRARTVGDFTGATATPLRIATAVAAPVAVRDFAKSGAGAEACRTNDRGVACR